MSINWSNLTEPALIPTWLYRRYIESIDFYDAEWKPMLSRIMPRRPAPGVGSKKHFSMPWLADPQGMAKFTDPRERTPMMGAPHIEGITYHCRTIRNGYPEDMEEFEEDFENGVIQEKRRMIDRNLIRYIDRLIEYTLTRYVYGDPVVMATFSTDSTERQGRANVRKGTFREVADSHLGGLAWDNASANIFKDLNYLKDRFELMSGEIGDTLVVGRVTTRSMEDNTGLLNRLIQIRDTTQGVLGAAIQGLKLVRVVGQTYKEVPGINTDREGFPGMGDYLRQTWDRLNKIDMMTTLYNSGRWEWGLITNSHEIGFTACGWTHKLHQAQRANPTQMYVRQWVEHDPLEVKNEAAISITPVVRDFAYALRLDQMAMQ